MWRQRGRVVRASDLQSGDPGASFSKVPITFWARNQIKYSNRNIRNKGAGAGQQTTPFCFTN